MADITYTLLDGQTFVSSDTKCPKCGWHLTNYKGEGFRCAYCGQLPETTPETETETH